MGGELIIKNLLQNIRGPTLNGHHLNPPFIEPEKHQTWPKFKWMGMSLSPFGYLPICPGLLVETPMIEEVGRLGSDILIISNASRIPLPCLAQEHSCTC